MKLGERNRDNSKTKMNFNTQQLSELDDSLELELLESDFYNINSRSESNMGSKDSVTFGNFMVQSRGQPLPRISEKEIEEDIMEEVEKMLSRNSITFAPGRESKQEPSIHNSHEKKIDSKIDDLDDILEELERQITQEKISKKEDVLNFHFERINENSLPSENLIQKHKKPSLTQLDDEIEAIFFRSSTSKPKVDSPKLERKTTPSFFPDKQSSSLMKELDKLEENFFGTPKAVSKKESPSKGEVLKNSITKIGIKELEKNSSVKELSLENKDSGNSISIKKPIFERKSARNINDPHSLTQQLNRSQILNDVKDEQTTINSSVSKNIAAQKKEPSTKKQTQSTRPKRRKPSSAGIRDNPPNAKTYKTKIQLNLGSDPKCQIDAEACKNWVYLTHRQFRRYQFDITETSLFNNTLVCLPTGMGKTFIAANIIYNFYRWYPKGKIFFLACTRPLVTQQIKSVEEIEGININDTTELTGSDHPSVRAEKYNQKRIFFMTPQTLQNDLERGILDLTLIVLIVYGRII